MSLLFLTSLAAIATFTTVAASDPLPYETIERDICIIGGGSSGTYAAIRLQQMNQSVALIERNDRLGGHVNTYVDAATNRTYDYGVISYNNISVVTDYYKYLEVAFAPYPPPSAAGAVSIYANFRNGSVVSPLALANGNATAAFLAYEKQLAKYPYLINGFNLPSPVPEDLLLSWGAFIKKYELDALAFEVYLYNQGVGNILDLPVLYMIKYLNLVEVQNLVSPGWVTTAHGGNQQLYDVALARLGSNAFISSNVTRITRSPGCIEVLVSTPNGQKLIRSSKLLMSIPPKVDNLEFLNLSQEEREVFGQFNNSYYWNGVLRNSGIPDNTSITNADTAAPYGIPTMPALYGLFATGIAGLHEVYFSSPHALSDKQVKEDIIAANARLVQGLGYALGNSTPEFAAFNAHNPFELTVSTKAIASGFYGRLESLQGRQNTWWTGAAWQSQDSSYIWNFTEHVVLPQLVA